MNTAVYPLYSKAEIDSKFFFSPGTSNTSFIWRESMYSSWTNDIPTPFNAYLELWYVMQILSAGVESSRKNVMFVVFKNPIL